MAGHLPGVSVSGKGLGGGGEAGAGLFFVKISGYKNGMSLIHIVPVNRNPSEEVQRKNPIRSRDPDDESDPPKKSKRS